MKRVTQLSDLKNIKAPEYLKMQTLEKARQTKTIHYKRRILAAACAFIIVFTGVYSYQKNNGISNEITNSFGLIAYAANTGEIIKPQDNILVFEEGGGIDSTIGFFTGCLFKITGENIEKVKISLDADGGIYRSKTFTEQDISLEEIQEIDKAQYEAMWNSEDIGIAGAQVCKNEKTKGSDLILPVYDEISEKLSFTGRKFVGKNGDGTAFGFDNMEKQEDADTVYIFPKDGQRYHKKDCTFVAPEAIQVILNEDLRKEYSPCESCDTKELANGATVYIFEAYGDSYHKKNCSTIEKNIIAIDRETAEEKGYTPCKKCGG